MALKTNRNTFLYLVLCVVTFGIYGLYWIYKTAQDVNTACAGDGRNTWGLLIYILLSFIGIGPIIWMIMLVSRLEYNVRLAGDQPRLTVLSLILWSTLGSIIIVGPIVALVKLIRSLNDVCLIYNDKNGLTY